MRRPHIIDMTGQVINMLTVLGLAPPREGTTAAEWLCQCECGRTVRVPGGSLRHGQVSCGCARYSTVAQKLKAQRTGVRKGPVSHISKGEVFTRLRATGKYRPRPGSGYDWEVVCSCGSVLWVPAYRLRSGNTRSCGCLRRDRATQMRGPLHPNYNPSLSDTARQRRKHHRCVSDGRWDRISRRAKIRASFVCCSCGKHGGALNTHHVFDWHTYPELRYTLANLVVLCTKCHTAFHRSYGYCDNDDKQLREFLDR